MTDDRLDIDTPLVRNLIEDQFPHWADLAIEAVEPGGWDNKTFRLGEDMSVRLPTAERYALQVEKEQLWLPYLASNLPYEIPVPIAKGQPTSKYPWPWSVYKWIEGEPAIDKHIEDLNRFAVDLARFLTDLQNVNTRNAPEAGEHNFFRGGGLSVYDTETRQALDEIADDIDRSLLIDIWNEALASKWEKPAVWIHGDMSPSNLLIRDGRLHAVIDFGNCGIGDPACDLVMAWTFFDEENRCIVQENLPYDKATWARASGWALWKALITIQQKKETHPLEAQQSQKILKEIIQDHKVENGVA